MFLFSTLFVFITPVIFCYVIFRFKEAKDKKLEFINLCKMLWLIACFLSIYEFFLNNINENVVNLTEKILNNKEYSNSLVFDLDNVIRITISTLFLFVSSLMQRRYIKKNYIDENIEEIN